MVELARALEVLWQSSWCVGTVAGEQGRALLGTGCSGILCVCCFSFLTKRLVLASLSVSFLGSRERFKVRAGKGHRGQNLAGLGHSSPQLPGNLSYPELMWVVWGIRSRNSQIKA